MPQRLTRAVPPGELMPSQPDARNRLDAALAQRASVMQDNARHRQSVPWRDRWRGRARSALALGGLMGALPLSAALPAWVGRKHAAFPKTDVQQRFALVLGVHMTKGLHLCRHLRAAGLRVIAADSASWHMAAARWSSAVEHFTTLPDPDIEPHAYIDAVVALANAYDPQVIITSATPNTALIDALAADRLRQQEHGPGHHWSTSAQLTAMLDNKLAFSQTCRQLQLPVPDFQAITSHQEAYALNARLPQQPGKQYLLKSLAYDPVARMASVVLPMRHAQLQAQLRDFDISDERPWMAQALVRGDEFSTYALAYRGRLVAYADTRACNLRYQHIDSQHMQAWVSKFCQALHIDGQICIDFMRDDSHGDRQLLAIECNPRASSVLTCFHDQPAFAQALCDPASIRETVKPHHSSTGQYWLYNELFTAMRERNIDGAQQVLRAGSDALLDARDPWPFFAMHAAQIPTLLARRCRDGIPWLKIDLKIGKLAELGGE